MIGFFAGLVVACVLSVGATLVFGLGADVSFLLGIVLGFVCTAVGMAVSD